MTSARQIAGYIYLFNILGLLAEFDLHQQFWYNILNILRNLNTGLFFQLNVMEVTNEKF